MTEGSPDYGDEYLTVADGLRLHYRDFAGAADKPPLLCLHGLTRNARSFDNLAARIAPRRRVIALDFRGRGLSDYDPQPERYTPLIYSGDVLHLLDELAIREAVFLGTSLGGLVTMIIAATAPQRIDAAIINDVGPDVAPGGVGRILTYVGKDVRFLSWDGAADRIASNYGAAFERYSHADWVNMAKDYGAVLVGDRWAIVTDPKIQEGLRGKIGGEIQGSEHAH